MKRELDIAHIEAMAAAAWSHRIIIGRSYLYKTSDLNTHVRIILIVQLNQIGRAPTRGRRELRSSGLIDCH